MKKSIFFLMLLSFLSISLEANDEESSEAADSSTESSVAPYTEPAQAKHVPQMQETVVDAEAAIDEARDKYKFISEFFNDGQFSYNKKFERPAYCGLNSRTKEECEVYQDYKNRHERKVQASRAARSESIARHNASVLSACEWAVKYRSDSPTFVKKICSKPAESREPSSVGSNETASGEKLIQCCLSYGSGSSCAQMTKSECEQVK